MSISAQTYAHYTFRWTATECCPQSGAPLLTIALDTMRGCGRSHSQPRRLIRALAASSGLRLGKTIGNCPYKAISWRGVLSLQFHVFCFSPLQQWYVAIRVSPQVEEIVPSDLCVPQIVRHCERPRQLEPCHYGDRIEP